MNKLVEELYKALLATNDLEYAEHWNGRPNAFEPVDTIFKTYEVTNLNGLRVKIRRMRNEALASALREQNA